MKEQVALEALESSPQPTVILDSTGTAIFANMAWRELARQIDGISADGVPGLNYAEVWKEDSPVRETLSTFLSAADRSFEIEHGPVADDRWYRVQGVTYETKSDQYVMVRHIEITTLKQATRRAKRFGAVIQLLAHDLQNPLAVSLGYKEMLEAKYDDERFETVDDHLQRMSQIIDDGLRLAQAGTIEKTESVSLKEIAERCWGRLDTTRASLEVDDSTTFRADPSLLDHVFENLIENAIRHGGNYVTVGVGTLENGFYVEDDGPGIPEDEREKVLEPGYSEHPTGTGLGLSIVQTITDSHGWELQLADSKRGGIRFEIRGVEVDE